MITHWFDFYLDASLNESDSLLFLKQASKYKQFPNWNFEDVTSPRIEPSPLGIKNKHISTSLPIAKQCIQKVKDWRTAKW